MSCSPLHCGNDEYKILFMKYAYKYLLASILLFVPALVSAGQRYDIPIEGSPSWGPEDAPVTIVEFIDYQ
jgi:hypothetical protein